jgi:hypothetical protein
MVTCVYRGKNAAGFFSGLTAIGMSVEMTAGVLVANLLEGMKFGLGPTTVVRKDSLASIGGYTALRDYIAYDFAIGNLIAKAGYQVVLSGHIIDHVVNQKSFQHMWQNQLRWAQTTRYSRPKGPLRQWTDFRDALRPAGIFRRGVAGTLGNRSRCCWRGATEPPGRGMAGGLDRGSRSADTARAVALSVARFARLCRLVRQLPEACATFGATAVLN